MICPLDNVGEAFSSKYRAISINIKHSRTWTLQQHLKLSQRLYLMQMWAVLLSDCKIQIILQVDLNFDICVHLLVIIHRSWPITTKSGSSRYSLNHSIFPGIERLLQRGLWTKNDETGGIPDSGGQVITLNVHIQLLVMWKISKYQCILFSKGQFTKGM